MDLEMDQEQIQYLNRGIYLENHPFKQNQKISFNLPTATSTNIGISTTPTGSIITLPSEVFVLEKILM